MRKFPRLTDQTVFGTRIQIYVWHLAFWYCVDDSKWIIGFGLFRCFEFNAFGCAIRLGAKSGNIDDAGNKVIGFIDARLPRGVALRLPMIDAGCYRGGGRAGVTQRAAGATDGDKHLRMTQAQGKSAEPTHRQTGDGAAFAPSFGTIIGIHIRNHVFDDMVFPIVELTFFIGCIINEPAIATIGKYQN